MDDKKPYAAPVLERTHHVWPRVIRCKDIRPELSLADNAKLLGCPQEALEALVDAQRQVEAERDEARAERIQRAVDIELDKARRFAQDREQSLVERDLVCHACRRHFGRILASVGAEVRPVCDGCVLEGRM